MVYVSLQLHHHQEVAQFRRVLILYRSQSALEQVVCCSGHQDQEGCPDVFTDMLRVLHLNVYALLDPRATFCFVTPYIEIQFNVNPETLSKPFILSTTIGDPFIVRCVYGNCPIIVSNINISRSSSVRNSKLLCNSRHGMVTLLLCLS